MDDNLAQPITMAFASMKSPDPAHQEVFDLEGYQALYPAPDGYSETLERAAVKRRTR
jgi:hypothetical protein